MRTNEQYIEDLKRSKFRDLFRVLRTTYCSHKENKTLTKTTFSLFCRELFRFAELSCNNTLENLLWKAIVKRYETDEAQEELKTAKAYFEKLNPLEYDLSNNIDSDITLKLMTT